MKDRKTIVWLRNLRGRREARAKETVIRRHGAVNRAARDARKASETTAAHLERTAADESTAFGSLVGQAVSTAVLQRVQGRFEMASRETLRLRENERAAGIAEEWRKAELSAARADHHVRLKAVTKLDQLLEDMSKRTAARQEALAELSEEEDRGPARPFTRH